MKDRDCISYMAIGGCHIVGAKHHVVESWDGICTEAHAQVPCKYGDAACNLK